MKIVTVLRSGGIFGPEHVRWLYDQLDNKYEKICLSDIKIEGIKTIPLTTNYPGWWAKIELFDPSKILDDIFYLDLDTVIVGDITELLENRKLTMLSDFFRPDKTKNSALMLIPHREKARVWNTFNRFPELFMKRYKKGGDQEFINKIYPDAETWQDLYPNNMVSYKTHVIHKKKNQYTTRYSIGNGSLPSDAKIVCFHGQPRPWDSGEIWVKDINNYK